MGFIKDSLNAVSDSIQLVYGITQIERTNPLEIRSDFQPPYCAMSLTGVALEYDTFGVVTPTCDIDASVIFRSEAELIDAMDRIEELVNQISEVSEVFSLEGVRVINQNQVKKLNYGMLLTFTLKGD